MLLSSSAIGPHTLTVKRGIVMHKRRSRCPPQRTYRQGVKLARIIGVTLIALGLLLLFLCIPGWAWAALAGCLLVAAGFLLIRVSRR